jgi:UDP-glucose 4-epimerase
VKVLVTGGRGWIGRATCAQLERRGHVPVPVDRRPHKDDPIVDVTNQADLWPVIREVDHVIHLAGVLGTHELLDQPRRAVNVNVMGGLNVVTACSEFDVGLTEITMPRVNPSLYAATKAAAMDIALAYLAAGKLRCSFVRAYNAYGPGQAYGGDHPQKIIPTFASRGWAGEPLPVWGDGLLWVDLVHVDDVARMLVEAMAFGDGQVFDAGSGYVQTVQTIAERVIQLTGNRSKIDYLPARPGERLHSTDRDVAKGEGWELLWGWRPVFDLERLAEAVDSYRPVPS